jgi:allantoicase
MIQPTDPTDSMRRLPDLAGERLGGRVLAANDDFFAPKENLLEERPPVWKEGAYTDRGKWMDGWETRRRREPGHDWCLLRLGLPGIPRAALVDTRHFKGNFPESASLEATAAPAESTVAALLSRPAEEWIEILPRTLLRGDTENLFELATAWRFTHLRLRIHPDGGVARLRILGEVVPEPGRFAGEIDLAAATGGGRVLDWSDRFFGPPHSLLLPDAPRGMHDGWETRRRRGPGNDWVVVRLGTEGRIRRIVVDTSHFKGNAPGSCLVEGAPSADGGDGDEGWRPLLEQTPLRPDHVHQFDVAGASGPVSRVRLSVFPDGGVARLRLLGEATEAGRRAAALRWLNALPPAEAVWSLAACGGVRGWAAAIAGRRPFASLEALAAAIEETADALAEADWRAAFASHPEIGEAAGTAHDAGARRWSGGEQSAAGGADAAARERLLEGNRRYRQRFGYPFIVRAAGRGLPEILEILERRLDADPATELRTAAAEQRDIARLRLRKLLGETP